MSENYSLSHLKELEAESIYIIREVAAEFENPVMLYSIGKDSSVMVRLAEKAFAPGKPPFPLMHIDSKWKFKEMLQFRDWYAKEHGWKLIVESNEEAFKAGVGPFTHGSKVHTDLMKTQALLHGLDKHHFDAAFGGARRDEEKSRAKERIFSFRDQFHQWDPKNQRPELWDIYNARIHKGESIRVFPLSNWTELDIWQYIRLENIPIVPLYFAKDEARDGRCQVAGRSRHAVVAVGCGRGLFGSRSILPRNAPAWKSTDSSSCPMTTACRKNIATRYRCAKSASARLDAGR